MVRAIWITDLCRIFVSQSRQMLLLEFEARAGEVSEKSDTLTVIIGLSPVPNPIE